jgi:predicted PurR-regulated permease PerM
VIWASQALHFEFAGRLSLAVILVLILGFIAWITYVATSIRKITKQMPNMVTKDQLVEEFRKFKLELSDDK